MKNITIKNAFFAAALMLTIVSCDSEYKDETPSIAGIAVANPNFSTLEGAAVQGGVVGVLSNSNPNDPSGHYTVFAPTNDAFARLGLINTGTLGGLQNGFLTNTLLYHVSNGDLLASQISNGGTSKSALGPNRRFISRGNDLYINGSKIILTNVNASNGTVHAIDKVMIATGVDIVQSAILLQTAKVFKAPELTFLVAAVVKSGLAPVLADPNANFTIYAPTDAAFKLAGFKTVQDVSNAPAEVLAQVLLNHAIAGGKFTSEQTSTTVVTAGGGSLTYSPFLNGTFTIKSGGITKPANMVIPDIQCSNGIVHVIDQVLIP
ncbi:Uncaracterized surface protein containing fasciclin (FAS1) repeats [Flavobacterium segetis]|uniref:Uncaracterized surface protein containing fasciclin (FAS1) repeats n=1 Tax=Flavobacterium segetis TaxID=271157 RepID=A0A1M5HDF4_9FLAO|nr:fasciclin domain-containing protein [Flavobacterium segetis]SHG13980.1 Uncaracterized surface protein containing fasciclin (FAS1) repeats [Flavobacterium segetis]